MGAVAVIVVVVIILFFVAMRFVGSDDPFQAAATALGLKLTRSVPELLPRLEGMINGLPVRIDIAEGRQPGVRYRVFYPPLGLSLRLERETTITRTLGELGQEDTQIGATAFDQSFKVNTSRPDALREVMDPELRRTLVKLIDDYPTALIEDGGIHFVSDTSEPPAEIIIQTMVDLAAAAQQLVRRRPKPLEKPKPSTRQPTPAPPPKAQSDTTKRQPPAPSPEPPRQASARVERPAAMPPPPPPPLPVTPPASDTGLPDTFFDDVFGDNRLSFEADGVFEARFRGKTVSLSGSVKQAREIEEDTTVTTGPATRAVVTVAQVENELYGKTDIDAVVFLPTGTADQLQRGEVISFKGMLATVDPFMRSLYVTDARLS